MRSVGEILKINQRSFRNKTKSKPRCGIPRCGFTMVPNMVIENTKMNIYEKMVLIVIKKHQMNKANAWPSQSRIAKQVRCSVTTVKKTVRILRFKGLIEVKRIGSFNSYKLIHSWVATSPTESRHKSLKDR
jgi:biotin operon repressor